METPTPISPASVHGPYEDAFIAGLAVLNTVLEAASPAQKVQLWSDFLAFHSALQTFATKIDVFHLFTVKPAAATPAGS